MSGQNRISHPSPGPHCSAHDPGIFSSDNEPVAGISSSTIIYKWQFNDAGTWQDISPSNVAALDPQPITVTTAYRRIASVIYAGLECELPSGSFISNVVTITVDGSLTNNPIISVASSDVTNQIFCKDQDVTFEITPSVQGQHMNTKSVMERG